MCDKSKVLNSVLTRNIGFRNETKGFVGWRNWYRTRSVWTEGRSYGTRKTGISETWPTKKWTSKEKESHYLNRGMSPKSEPNVQGRNLPRGASGLSSKVNENEKEIRLREVSRKMINYKSNKYIVGGGHFALQIHSSLEL